MLAGTPPFMEASKHDNYFKTIIMNRLDLFWKMHTRNKPSGANFFTEDFKALVISMFSIEPVLRPSIAEIRAHPWMKGPTSSKKEVDEELKVPIDVPHERQGLPDRQQAARY